MRTIGIDPRGPDAFDPERILAAVGPKTRMIVIGSPSNPTGRVITRAAVERISAGLLARGGAPVYVMHDEIYRELRYTDDVGGIRQGLSIHARRQFALEIQRADGLAARLAHGSRATSCRTS